MREEGWCVRDEVGGRIDDEIHSKYLISKV